MRRQYAFFTAIVLTLLVFGVVWAQDATPEATPEATTQIQPLSYGTPVNGTIDDTTYQQQWPLGTASGDRVQVVVQRTSGNLIPDVQILDASGSSIADSYGADQTYATAQIDNFTLPAAGNYMIQVMRQNGADGATHGDYTLEVIPLGTGADNPNNQTVDSEVQADTPVDGEVTATHWQHLYTYNAQGADELDVIVKRTGGTLYPLVTVLDSNGSALQTGYNQNDYADTNRFQLPAAGQYTVAVSRYNDQDGATLGTYELTVHLIGSGEDSPLLAGAMGDVAYDQELDGNVSPAQWYEDWSLTTDAGDAMNLTVTRTSGDLMPEVILLGGSGQELSHGYTDNTGATAQVTNYTLAGKGTYTVRVTRQSGQTGETSGGYALTVGLIGTGEGSAKLSETEGEITLGQPASGEITNARWENVWTFTAAQAGSIDVTVKRASGTLSPMIEIRDANDQEMDRGYPGDTRDSAEITSYRLPGAGTYEIVVGREGDQTGMTNGKYTVTVSNSQS